METNTNMAGQEAQANNAGAEDVQEKVGGKEQKMFTQEEVNSFVQSRLSRYKGQAEKEVRADYDQKLKELNDREMKLLMKEQLHDRNMPKELADIITCIDENDLKRKLDALQKIYGGGYAAKNQVTGFQIGAASDGRTAVGSDPVRKAIGLI